MRATSDPARSPKINPRDGGPANSANASPRPSLTGRVRTPVIWSAVGSVVVIVVLQQGNRMDERSRGRTEQVLGPCTSEVTVVGSERVDERVVLRHLVDLLGHHGGERVDRWLVSSAQAVEHQPEGDRVGRVDDDLPELERAVLPADRVGVGLELADEVTKALEGR